MTKVTLAQCPECGAHLKVEITEVNVTLFDQKKGGATTETSEQLGESAQSKKNAAELKIEALKAAGINTSNLFAIQNTNGQFQVGCKQNGHCVILEDDNPVFSAILKNGTIPDRRLFRRWIMGQVFHMLTVKDYDGKVLGFSKMLNNKGYKYQWTMVIEELRVQAKLYENDQENYLERNRWFNRSIAVEMAKDYIETIKDMVMKSKPRKCKGEPYVKLHKTNVFIKDLEEKVYRPLNKALSSIRNSKTPNTIHKAVKNFYELICEICLTKDMKQSKEFQDAYKGAGAFYTLKNLILFHGGVFPKMNEKKSINHLNKMVADKELEGYKLFGVMKEFLTENNIDIAKKQAEWRMKKSL